MFEFQLGLFVMFERGNDIRIIYIEINGIPLALDLRRS